MTSSAVAERRRERWMQYARLGQSTCGIMALTAIMSDKSLPPDLRQEAASVAGAFTDLIARYKEALNDL